MSILRNALGAIVPVREQRAATGTLNALNSELVLQVNGDENAVAHILSAAFIGTLEFSGSVGGVAYFSIPAYPFAVGSAGGTIPLSSQPLLLDALVAANTGRVYSIPCGQLKAVRVRVSAYTSGQADILMAADPGSAPLNSAINARSGTLFVTATGAAAAAVTATLPAVAGLRHIVDFIEVTRSASVALTAGAAPTVVTTTNLPGSPALTFGADAALQGQDKVVKLDYGSTGGAATALGAATTVVCPGTTGVIWRVNVSYRLGL